MRDPSPCLRAMLNAGASARVFKARRVLGSVSLSVLWAQHSAAAWGWRCWRGMLNPQPPTLDVPRGRDHPSSLPGKG